MSNIETMQIYYKQDHKNILELSTLINQAYLEGEGDILNWTDEFQRLDVNSLTLEQQISNQEIIVAELEGKIIGTVRKHKLDETTCYLGQIAVDNKYRQHKIGQKLVDFFIQSARQQNFKFIKAEIVNPTKFEHTFKKFIYDWFVGHLKFVEMSRILDLKPIFKNTGLDRPGFFKHECEIIELRYSL